MKKYILYILVLAIVVGISHAQADEFAEAKKLIDAKAPCSKLTEAQLEMIGDYYMELMHPGDLHQAMEEKIGGEGSESLRLMHISIAQRHYCGNYSNGSYGMMGGSSAYFMMPAGGRNMAYGMMGSYGLGYGLTGFLYTLLLIGLVILVYMWIYKLWKETGRSKK